MLVNEIQRKIHEDKLRVFSSKIHTLKVWGHLLTCIFTKGMHVTKNEAKRRERWIKTQHPCLGKRRRPPSKSQRPPPKEKSKKFASAMGSDRCLHGSDRCLHGSDRCPDTLKQRALCSRAALERYASSERRWTKRRQRPPPTQKPVFQNADFWKNERKIKGNDGRVEL